MIHGILPVYKPIGLSSYDIIRKLKGFVDNKQKIGHAGTLDVFASGVLILLLGDLTSEFDYFQTLSKTYVAGVRFGYSSDSLDIEGEFTKQEKGHDIPKLSEIRTACNKFTGTFEQKVPAYSAAKQDGKKLYELAREGKEIIEKSKEVTVEDIYIIAYKYPLATLRVTCGSGTYIRQLSYDIFQSMGIESMLYSLERTTIGEINLEDCCTLNDFKTGDWENFLFTLQDD